MPMSHLVLCLAVPSGRTNDRPPNLFLSGEGSVGTSALASLAALCLTLNPSPMHSSGDPLLWQAALQSSLVPRNRKASWVS